MKLTSSQDPRKPFDQDKRQRWHWQHKVLLAFALVIVAAIAIGGVASAAAPAAPATWSPRAGCEYTVKDGDKLNQISARAGVPVTSIVATNPHITNPDKIWAGDVIDICHFPHDAEDPYLVDVIPVEPAQIASPELVKWAQAVTDNRPDWADDHMTRFMVAVTHFESSGCQVLWNPNDAGWENGVEYSGSYGCNQIRVRADGSVQHRNLEWLRNNYDHQAQAAWIIFGERHHNGKNPYRAWGPTHNTERYGVKLHQDGSCGGTWKPAECEKAWANADAALGVAVIDAWQDIGLAPAIGAE